MERGIFFERMERELNLQHEYEKIDSIILNEKIKGNTIDDVITYFFGRWQDKKNFISFYELRSCMGFLYNQDPFDIEKYPTAKVKDINDFLLYCEMMMNMFAGTVLPYANTIICDKVKMVNEIMLYDLEKLNYEAKNMDDRIIIVQKDASVISVADIVESTLADTIVEYNHFLLKGDIEKKKSILKAIANALEPKRRELDQINKIFTSDLFYLLNNMNIRHNNCDENDFKNYNPVFARLSVDEVETWYDDIFQQELMAFLFLEQKKRNIRINTFKKAVKENI